MEDTQLKGILEAVLLTSDQPLTIDNMLAIFDEEEKPDRATVRKVLEWLQNDFTERSIELKEVGSGFRMDMTGGTPIVARHGKGDSAVFD